MNASRLPSEKARPMLCSDPLGEDLVITIRISADGMVYLHDIPPGLVPVVAALAPGNSEFAERIAQSSIKVNQL